MKSETSENNPVAADESQVLPQEIPTLDQLAEQQPAQTLPTIERSGNKLILTGGATLPESVCIKSGKRAKTIISVGLQNPFRPHTWFTRGAKVSLGLSPKNLESYRISQTISYASIALGLVMIPVGIVSGLITALVGLLVCVIGLIVRAMSPIWVSSQNDNRLVIRGCGDGFLAHFPEA